MWSIRARRDFGSRSDRRVYSYHGRGITFSNCCLGRSSHAYFSSVLACWLMSGESLGFFHEVIGLRATVEPPSMPWHNAFPVQGGWHCRPSWNTQDCRHGGCGRGMPRLRRRIFSRPELTRGAQESLGDRNAGTAMWRTPIRPQRRLGSEPT
jgi:hypothetical protein